jgi:hypothetical protein
VEEALHEIGVLLTDAYPEPLTDEVVQASDVVITMGCGDACPIYPGKRYLDWEFEDSAGQPLERVRAIRDDIDCRVRELLAELPCCAGVPAMPARMFRSSPNHPAFMEPINRPVPLRRPVVILRPF